MTRAMGSGTPLAVLKAELDLAQSRSRTNQELQAAVRSAAEEADRLTALAETLLIFSRAEGGRVPLHRRQARLDELFQAASSALAARASGAGVDVRVVPYGVTAFVDAVLVRQVVENVVSNALGHTPRGGQVRVSATRDGDTVRLTVEDSGTGFDPAFPAQCF